jgi:hypothetical protein
MCNAHTSDQRAACSAPGRSAQWQYHVKAGFGARHELCTWSEPTRPGVGRPKQDEIEMEARGLGPEGPGACLERRSSAPRCTREPVRLQDPVIPDLVSALTL